MADDVNANANVDANAGTKPADDGGANAGTGGEDEKPVSRAEFTKIMERMQAADRRATAAEKERDANKKIIDDAETAKLGEVAKANKERDDAKALAEAQAAELKNTKLENAFAMAGGVNWFDAATAYAVLQQSYMAGVEIKDGKVEGMKEAIEKMVKEKPFLVNKDVVQPAPEATGSNHNRRAGSDAEKEKAYEADLKKRMPGAFRHTAVS
jgi:hypothetical protein